MNLLLDSVRKDYGGRSILKDCSYVFDAGGVYVLMGANGAGKSTLLRICALLEQADGGTLVFTDSGAALPSGIALRRRITLVLPRTGVFNASVFRNVAYGLTLRGLPAAVVAERVRSVLGIVGLEHKIEQHARTLSSGETQRMGLARALAIDPEILFLDEPTASVDEENTMLIEQTIRSLREFGRTMIIMTTHDREQAERLGDHLLFLQQGRLVRAGLSLPAVG